MCCISASFTSLTHTFESRGQSELTGGAWLDMTVAMAAVNSVVVVKLGCLDYVNPLIIPAHT